MPGAPGRYVQRPYIEVISRVELGTKSGPPTCSVGIAVEGLWGAGVSAATEIATPMWTRAVRDTAITVAVVARSAGGTSGDFCTTNADNGIGDTAAGFSAVEAARGGATGAAFDVVGSRGATTDAVGLAAAAPALEPLSAGAGATTVSGREVGGDDGVVVVAADRDPPGRNKVVRLSVLRVPAAAAAPGVRGGFPH